jgi:aspartyl-tRNA(Asn)/glutamyl-tRNA(Gln) amidotransferase subunit C
MALSREEVRHIALLARLELSPHEEATFTEQLAHILQHFEKLAALDTETVEPTAQVVETPSDREDVVTNPPATEDMYANAPARDGNFFMVPKIIE